MSHLIPPHNVFDIFNDPSTDGPFVSLATLLDTDCPDWLSGSASYMDEEYIFDHATSKQISRHVEIILKTYDHHPTGHPEVYTLRQVDVNTLMETWWDHNQANITKLREAMTKVYDPLSNYDMEEKTTPNLTETVQTKSNVRTTGSNKVYGFNSATAVPATDTQADTVTQGADTANQMKKTNTGTNTLTRKGNIGVTTSQQMAQAEIELRENHNFFEMVFAMLDKQLTTCGYTQGVSEYTIIT